MLVYKEILLCIINLYRKKDLEFTLYKENITFQTILRYWKIRSCICSCVHELVTMWSCTRVCMFHGWTFSSSLSLINMWNIHTNTQNVCVHACTHEVTLLWASPSICWWFWECIVFHFYKDIFFQYLLVYVLISELLYTVFIFILQFISIKLYKFEKN